MPEKCLRKIRSMENYEGIERRSSDRRQSDLCIWHEAHEERFLNNERKIVSICKACDSVREAVDNIISTKVPMRLFYATAAGIIVLVISILAFQWTIYEKLNYVGLGHTQTVGDIRVDMQKITSAIDNDRYINKLKMEQLDYALKAHLESANKEYKDIRESLDELNTHIQNGN